MHREQDSWMDYSAYVIKPLMKVVAINGECNELFECLEWQSIAAS